MDMDNFCTPINQLGSEAPVNRQPQENTENNKEPLQVQNYSDILKSINTTEQKPMNSINQINEIQQQNVQQMPVSNHNEQYHAQLQQQYAYHQQQQQQQSQPVRVPQTKPILNKNFYCDNDFQNESLSLLCVYVLINSEFFQNFLKTKFPSIINTDTGKINIIGIIIQGIILIFGFNFTKKVVLKYIKDA